MNICFLCSFCTVLLSCNVLGGVIRRHGYRTRAEQMAYLQRFGYAGRASNADLAALSMSSGAPGSEINAAVRHFQRMARIPQTGFVDEATIQMMNAPRCGVPDDIDSGSRQKRYVLAGSKWPKHLLSYRMINFTADIPETIQVSTFNDAFSIWSKVARLAFTRNRYSRADVNIAFARLQHGDGNDFDGPGGTLAHAFFPTNGVVHFDDGELWTVGRISGSGTDLLQVAVHEIGHALGLKHSEVYNSIMYPFYKKNLTKVELHSDDISGIQQLYGAKLFNPRG